MILARNQLVVPQSYDLSTQFETVGPPAAATKIDVMCYLGIPVIMQINERPGVAFPDPVDTEILLNPGFNSRGLPPFYAFRFRLTKAGEFKAGTVPSGNGLIDFAAMGET